MKLPFSSPSVIIATVRPSFSNALMAEVESSETFSIMTSASFTPAKEEPRPATYAFVPSSFMLFPITFLISLNNLGSVTVAISKPLVSLNVVIPSE